VLAEFPPALQLRTYGRDGSEQHLRSDVLLPAHFAFEPE
jgi:hypothetical protein